MKTQEGSMEFGGGEASLPSVIDDLMAGGTLLPEQMATAGAPWSPELKLAAAVLASALQEVRDHCGQRAYLHRVAETLQWIGSNDTVWPFAFLRLCALFGLDPDWVRAAVERWISQPRTDRVPRRIAFRSAA